MYQRCNLWLQSLSEQLNEYTKSKFQFIKKKRTEIEITHFILLELVNSNSYQHYIHMYLHVQHIRGKLESKHIKLKWKHVYT